MSDTVFLRGPWQLPLPHDSRQRTKQSPVDTQSRSHSDTKTHNILFPPTHHLPAPKILIHSGTLKVTQTGSLPFTCVRFGTTSQARRGLPPRQLACGCTLGSQAQPPTPWERIPAHQLGPDTPGAAQPYNTSTAARMATSPPRPPGDPEGGLTARRLTPSPSNRGPHLSLEGKSLLWDLSN